MFGIFQVDLPIGRVVWLVVMSLVATSLIAHVPLNLAVEPSTLALSLLVYTGYSCVIGTLISMVPALIIRLIDIYCLFRRSEPWSKQSLLFVDYQYDRWSEIALNACVASVAALSIGKFGSPSLYVIGALGLLWILLLQVLDLESLFAPERWPLLELRAYRNTKALVRLFLAGKLFREVRLDQDASSALAKLLSANWRLIPDLKLGVRGAAWLRKDIPARRLRFIAKIIEWRREHSAMDDMRSFWVFVARWLAVAGIVAFVLGSAFVLYLVHKLDTENYISRAQGAVALAMAGVGLLSVATAFVFAKWNRNHGS